MATLVPAILTKEKDELLEKIKILETVEEISDVQIDFEDGQFVRNTTVLPKDLLGQLETRLKIEAHLMVSSPQNYLHDLERLAVDAAIIHYESFSRVGDLIATLDNMKYLNLKRGVAINPDTEVSTFDKLLPHLEICLLMSVHPGFQGQKFLPETLKRLQILRKLRKNVIIEVDGGINLKNFQNVIEEGAERIVVGSGIWQTRDPKQTIREFLKQIK